MEETLGRRIASGRKKLNLTQDQLAEKLGVTAQAVSKWENDQSCPDITMLPKLAALFDTSVDALLGVVQEQQEPVHQGEVVQPQKERKWNWDFHFDDVSGSRAGSVCFALMVLLCGVLLLLGSVLELEYSFWDVLWPSALLFLGIAGLWNRGLYFSIGCIFFGGLFLLSNTGLVPLDIGKGWVFPVLLILFGLGMLPHAFKKKRPVFSFTYDSEKDRATKSSCAVDDGYFECVCSFGDSNHLIETPVLQGGTITTSFGDHTIDLRGCQKAHSGAVIDASCSFGDTNLLVPRHIRLVPDRRTSFGDVSTQGQPYEDAVSVVLNANVSFGDMVIRYL